METFLTYHINDLIFRITGKIYSVKYMKTYIFIENKL